MNPSVPLLLALPLMLWSWQGGHWIIGPALALWLEWAQRTSRRWAMEGTQINRLVDLSSLVLLGVVLYHYANAPLADGLFAALHWSPLLLLPLLSAQLLSGRPGIERRALFYSQRRSTEASAAQTLDLLPVYVGACLLAAGQASLAPRGYFIGLALLVGWILWWLRPARASRLAWLLMLALAVGLGQLGHEGLRQVRGHLEDMAIAWLSRFFHQSTDPYRATTAIGDLGRLNLSDRIRYRVESPQPLQNGLLLRTASYDRYFDTSWLSRRQGFREQTPAAPASWQWLPTPTAPSAAVWISAYLEGRQSILPIPLGTWRIRDLPVAALARHELGALRVGEGPGLVRYRADYLGASSDDAPPGETDLRVPRAEQPALAALAEQLGLPGLDTAEAMRRVRDHFRQQFRYSLELPGKTPGQTALEHFLRERRQGHCEYFASATVLLLRQAGVAARYAVGYAVTESAGTPNQYLVRNSHAHAWSLVWHQGQWWNLDTTPSQWAELEAERRPRWQPLLDIFSDLYYRFSLGRLNPDAGQNPWLWGTLALLFALLAYRLRLGKAFRHRRSDRSIAAPPPPDTPLAHLEARLRKAGLGRNPWETYGGWLSRLRAQPQPGFPQDGLDELLRLHYLQRYGQQGLNLQQQAQQQRLWQQWLRRAED
jgi:transglutaminase-like putative cysteine protease